MRAQLVPPGYHIKFIGQTPVLVPDHQNENNRPAAITPTPQAPPPPLPEDAPTVEPTTAPPFIDPVVEQLYADRLKWVRKYSTRPTRLADVVGRADELDLLEALLSNDYPSNIIIVGDPGTGKSLVADMAIEIAKGSGRSPFSRFAPRIKINGATATHDGRNNISSIASVVMDTFYSGVRERNARLGLHPDTPDLYIGAMARANLGVLYIDEIGELAHGNVTALLVTMEDGIERLLQRGSGAWMSDPRSPPSLVHFFRHGLPASFVLIGATTRDPNEIDPALRSRCEIVRFKSLTEDDRREIARRSAEKLRMTISDETLDRIASTKTSGRDANRRVTLAASAARRRGSTRIEIIDAYHCPAVASRAGFRP